MLRRGCSRVGVFLVIVISLMGLLGCDRIDSSNGVMVDEPFPELTLTTLDGEPFIMDALRGQVVIVKLWATWCGVCRETEPQFKTFARQLDDEVVVASVSVDGDLNLVREYLLDRPNDFVQLFDKNMIQSKSVLNAYVIPQVYIIDKLGVLKYYTAGGVEWDGDMLKTINRIKEGY